MKRLLVSILALFFFAATAAIVTPSSQANFSVKSATFNKFDNSARNKFNLDPGKEAPYGKPTYDEILRRVTLINDDEILFETVGTGRSSDQPTLLSPVSYKIKREK